MKDQVSAVLKHFHVVFYGNMQPEKVAFDLKLGQSKPIYNAFKEIREGDSWETLTEAQQRIVEGSFSPKFQIQIFYLIRLMKLFFNKATCLS